MTENELLTLAAQAVNGGAWHPLTHDAPNGRWNPLDDDGDALRLAVMLGIEPGWYERAGYACASALAASGNVIRIEEYGTEALQCTRRAIVRAAAAMAKDAP